MKTGMKIALGAVGVVAVAAIALPALVPAEKIKAQLVEQVKAATGRDLLLDGKVSVAVFPALSVQVTNVALTNPAGFKSKDLIRLGGVDVRLKLMPLLSGQVQIDSFVLNDPVISLEVDPQGHPDWAFDKGAAPASKAKEPAAPDTKTAAGKSPLSDIHLGDVRIVNGTLTYADDKAGTSEKIEGIDLQIALKSLDQPLAVKGALKWRGQSVTLGIDMAAPRALIDGAGKSALAVTLASDPLKLSLTGDVNGADKGLTGLLDLSVPSVRGLAAWTTGKPLDMPGTGLGPLSIKGKLSAVGAHVAFTQAALALDAIKAEGDFSADTGGAKPEIKAVLAVETLDLNPYLSSGGQDKAGDGGGKPASDSKPAPAAAKQDWSDDPIDASALKSAEADLTLTVGAIKVRKIQVGKSRLTVALHGGKMAADLTELALYKGAGKGHVALDGSQPGVGIDAAFALKGLDAEPFLTDAAGLDRLSGTGNFDVQITGRGHSQRQIVSSLGGKGAVSFTDGAIKGINLAAMMRNVTTAFTDTGAAQKTDFAELSGTFSIASGIVSNQDLALKAPVLRVAGAGTVDLPKRTINYRVEPKVAATTEGQGGQDAGGLSVPVVVEGPWDNVSYRPDLASMLKGGAQQTLKSLLGGGGASGQAGGKALPLPINPGNLFGK